VVIPAFRAMREMWEECQITHPNMSDIIDKGLEKLTEYFERIEEVPVHVLAMGEIDLMLHHNLIY
jgi:hypothetical protein